MFQISSVVEKKARLGQPPDLIPVAGGSYIFTVSIHRCVSFWFSCSATVVQIHLCRVIPRWSLWSQRVDVTIELQETCGGGIFAFCDIIQNSLNTFRKSWASKGRMDFSLFWGRHLVRIIFFRHTRSDILLTLRRLLRSLQRVCSRLGAPV